MSEDFNKYLAIANHDIQMAKNMGELKNYVASILYDNDKKVDMIHELEEQIKLTSRFANKSKELQDRIDKAIEYIKRNYRVLLLTDPPREAFDINELLEILGDKE